MKKTILILLTGFFCMTAFAYGTQSQPMEDLKGPIEQGIAILKDPLYTGLDKKEAQREKIWELVRQVFDFKAISMRALARSWKDFNEQQQEDFTNVFAELLKNTYIDKIQGEFHDEQIIFLDQDMLSDEKAQVKTKILRGKLEIPMDYSMKFMDGKWRVYDVNIEGVSMVKNYRNQFKSVLEDESPTKLIERLKEKNEKHEHDRKMEK